MAGVRAGIKAFWRFTRPGGRVQTIFARDWPWRIEWNAFWAFRAGRFRWSTSGRQARSKEDKRRKGGRTSEEETWWSGCGWQGRPKGTLIDLAQCEADHQKKTNAARADSPSGEDESSSAFATGGIQTLASPDEVAFFDKVKKFIDDKVTYHEFLKLINLFVQDMIDTKTLVERAETFIGGSGDVWAMFRKIVGADDAGNTGPHPTSAQGGYGFGGMISVDSQVVENTPMLERNKPYLDGPRVKAFGPSYRKLPKSVSK